jgi:hypothetical protein
MQRDIWELYGATRLRAQEHLDRAEALLREANATSGSFCPLCPRCTTNHS